MFGDKFNLGNLGNLLKGAKKFQEMMEQAQEDLAKIEVSGEAGAGAVQITMTAKYQAKKVTIEDSLLTESKEVIEDLIAAAINDAANKVEVITKSKMMDAGKLFGGLSEDEGKK